MKHFLLQTVGTLRRFGASNIKINLIPRASAIFPRRHLFVCRQCWSRIGSKTSSKVTPLFLAAEEHLGRTAIIDQNGSFSYDDILHHSSVLSKKISDLTKFGQNVGKDGPRIAFLCENDMSYVVTQWAIWMLGATGVPLCKSHPISELEYFVEDSESSLLITTEDFADTITPIANKLQIYVKVLEASEYIGSYESLENNWFISENPQGVTHRGKKGRLKSRYDDLLVTNQYKKQPAIIVYTSGTTGKPKGVVLTHGNLYAMMTGMVSAWEWRRDDVILHVLPLHHVHGIVNVLMTPLFVGATCLMMTNFDPAKVWSHLLNPVTNRISLFMAVPTIYAKLLEDYDSRMMRGRGSRITRQYIKSVCKDRIRLMVSGSAALPQPIMERWEQVTGHRLLERYGMTEIGMALTNPLHGPRIPGSVGNPFPGVEVCIGQPNVYSSHGYNMLAIGNSRGTTVFDGGEGEQGELMVKGPNVFPGYWNKPEATEQAFTKDGWFKTGDTAMYKDGAYSILGRTSVDVIKSGGYKISALYVERHLLAHPDITDCAVLGLPDITWGQKVAAILVLKSNKEMTQGQLKGWARECLPPYQIPTVVKCLENMPRNAMGKVNKKELMLTVFPEYFNRKL